MRWTTIFLLAPFLCFHICYGQTAFEDSESKSSLILFQGGAGKINFSETSFSLNYIYRNSQNKLRFGAEISGKLTEGMGTLFDDGSFQPGAGLKASIGWELNTVAPQDSSNDLADTKGEDNITLPKWLTVVAGYSRTQFDLFKADESAADQIAKEPFDGLFLAVHYNALVCDGECLFGLSLGVERQNNFQSLPVIVVVDRKNVYTEPDSTRTIEKTMNVRSFDDFKTNGALIINGDFVWVPRFLGHRIGIDFFGRIDTGKKGSKAIKPGIGFFMAEENAPTRVVGGISFEFEGFKLDGLRVGLVTGFKF